MRRPHPEHQIIQLMENTFYEELRAIMEYYKRLRHLTFITGDFNSKLGPIP